MLRTSLSQVLRHEASETREAFKEIYQFVRTHNWKATLRYVFQRKYWKWRAGPLGERGKGSWTRRWILLAVVITLSTVLASFHDEIATAIHPYSEKIASNGWAWIIPIGLLFIVSFPPLFGHELILIVCGMVWGLWRGFAIAALGTFIGELGTYVAFKYFFRQKARELEENHIIYACCAKMMRDGGLPMLILVRFSAMPGHIVTAIQSCIGIGIWMYAVAAFVTLPKQFALCYLGKIFGDTVPPLGDFPPEQQTAIQTAETATKNEQRKISFIVFAVTVVATGIAAYLVWMRARALRPTVVAEMEARKLAREEQATRELSFEGMRAARRKDRVSGMSLGELQPPAFVDLIKWSDSKPGLLMTPTDEVVKRASSCDRSTLGMPLNSPSLPHLPRYTSRIVSSEDLLAYGRPRSRTSSSYSSHAGSSRPSSSPAAVSPRAREPSSEVQADYFGAASSFSVGRLEEGNAADDADETPTFNHVRRQSEPNCLKKDWA